MVKKIIKTYLTLFIVFYAGYSFLNWFFTTKTVLVRIDKDYSNFWIPFLIIYIPVFFVLRPLVKKSNFKDRTQDALLWVLFPFSIGIPTAFSQGYFKDISYNVINVNNPKEVHLYPDERFFKIKTFYVNRNDFTLFKERHVSGGKSKSLKVNNYYIAPMFNDDRRVSTGIAYGLKFSTSLNHGLLFRKEQPKKIWEYNIKSASEFTFYDLDSVTYFEKQMNSEDGKNFAEAWRRNDLIERNVKPVVLVGKTETFQQHISKEGNFAMYSVLISLTVGVGLLLIFEYSRK